MAGVPAAGFKQLLETGEHSDFLVACEGTEFKVHRAIITPASEYFKIMCRDDFKETDEARIELEESQPGIVARVLDFIYTGEYSAAIPPFTQTFSLSNDITSTLFDPMSGDSCKDSREADLGHCISLLKTHTLVYQLSDMLGISNLRRRALDEFMAGYNVHLIQIKGFDDLLDLVFTTTPPTDNDLRRFVVERCIRQHEDIERDRTLLAVLERHEPMAWLTGVKLQTDIELLECLKSSSDDTVSKSQDKITRLTDEIMDLKIAQRVGQTAAYSFGQPR